MVCEAVGLAETEEEEFVVVWTSPSAEKEQNFDTTGPQNYVQSRRYSLLPARFPLEVILSWLATVGVALDRGEGLALLDETTPPVPPPPPDDLDCIHKR